MILYQILHACIRGSLIMIRPLRPLASSPINGRSGERIHSVFPFLPFMGKGARRADRGGSVIYRITKILVPYFKINWMKL